MEILKTNIISFRIYSSSEIYIVKIIKMKCSSQIAVLSFGLSVDEVVTSFRKRSLSKLASSANVF